MSEEPLLSLSDLAVEFTTRLGVVRAVEGVTWTLHEGETLAIVGESGSGKSVAAMSVLGLTHSQGGKITRGSIRFAGRELVGLSQDEWRKLRGNRIAMIFQEPMTSLNPVFTVGDQVTEVLELHRGMSGVSARAEALRLFDLVGIPSPDQRLDEYPHQLSGGMRQRVMIAMSLACNPKVLIADEPTTALDVTVQAQILDLLRDLQRRLRMAILLITHDLGVVASMAQRVNVMYAGRIVESAPVIDLFERPKHPYTVGLLESLPKLKAVGEELRPIEGNVPDALSLPSGCRFHPRCPLRFEPCDREQPQFTWLTVSQTSTQSHGAACHYTAQHPDVDLRQLVGAELGRRRSAREAAAAGGRPPVEVLETAAAPATSKSVPEVP
jgi:oligopeptide transport system ATP-binding protein